MMKEQRGDFSLDVEEVQPANRRAPDRLPDEWLDLASLGGSELHNALMEFPAEPSGPPAQTTSVDVRERLVGRLSLPLNKRGLLLILVGATIGLAALAAWRVSLQPVATGAKPPERARAAEPSAPVASTADLPPSTLRPDAAVSAPDATDAPPPLPEVEPSRVRPDALEAPRAATTAASPAAAPRSLEPLSSAPATLPPQPLALLRTRPVAGSSVLAKPAPSVPPVATARLSAVVRPMPDRDVSAATRGLGDLPDIERVVRAYQESYNQLDASSTALVWPTVDTGALARAFSTLVAQQLSFDRCKFDVEGGTATASCAGALRYVQRIGDPTPQVQQMSWAFQLERTDRGWQIEEVTARGAR
ncbi:MAG: hypothetical protein ACRD2X_22195 [Vicinamibacteraceae bacterium]